MKVMRMLYDQCMEELEGAICYAKCATEYAQMDPEMSKMYLSMAKTELDHAKALHSAAQKKATSKMGKEDIDPRLMELWEEMESVKIDKMAMAKAYVDNAS